DLGVNLIDTAEMYGEGISESIVGEAIRARRNEATVATKVSPTHLRYSSVLKAAERSLGRLGIREIDLYQIHWPNPLVPLKETMRAMEKLVSNGKIRYIGVSNFSAGLLMKAQEALAKEEIVSNQVKYNLLQRGVEKQLLPYAKREGMTILAYSPLAQGMLTGKFSNPITTGVRSLNAIFTNRGNFNRSLRIVDVVRKIGENHGRTTSQVALSWLMSDSTVVPIPGAKSVEQLKDNIAAADWRLTPEDRALIDAACESFELKRSVNPLPAIGFIAGKVYRKIVG
ncbi:MAG: aldo/keto reductase, partial [Candidatus Bathyarchaeia archaeon]